VALRDVVNGHSGDGLVVVRGDLEVFFNLNDSVILFHDHFWFLIFLSFFFFSDIHRLPSHVGIPVIKTLPLKLWSCRAVCRWSS